MTEFVERLRELAVASNDGHLVGPALAAADEIKRLRARAKVADAEVGCLREALQAIADMERNEPVLTPNEFHMQRIARAALADARPVERIKR